MEVVCSRSIIESVAQKVQQAIQLATRGEEATHYLRIKQDERARLIDLRVSGLISKEDYTTRLKPIQAEIDRIEARSAARRDFSDIGELTHRIMATLSTLPQASPRDKRQIVKGFIQKIFVKGQRIINIIPTPEAMPLFAICKVLQMPDYPQHLTILNLVDVPPFFTDINLDIEQM